VYELGSIDYNYGCLGQVTVDGLIRRFMTTISNNILALVLRSDIVSSPDPTPKRSGVGSEDETSSDTARALAVYRESRAYLAHAHMRTG
jgi:hypothetical protein